MSNSMSSNEMTNPSTAQARFRRLALLLLVLASLTLVIWSSRHFLQREGPILRREHEQRLAEREREQKWREARAIRETITNEGGDFQFVKGRGIQLDLTTCDSPDEALSDLIRLAELEADLFGRAPVSLTLGPAFCDRHFLALSEVRNLTYLDLTATTFTEQEIKRLRVYLADDVVIRIPEDTEQGKFERGGTDPRE